MDVQSLRNELNIAVQGFVDICKHIKELDNSYKELQKEIKQLKFITSAYEQCVNSYDSELKNLKKHIKLEKHNSESQIS